jgi:beta-fructofuranosidase
MVWTLAVSSIVLGALPFSTAQTYSEPPELQLPAELTADYIRTLGNNSLFTRWRPTYHFMSPAGWLNVSLTFDYLDIC